MANVCRLIKDIEKGSEDFKAISQEVDAIPLSVAELEKIHRTEIGQDFADKFYPRAEGHIRNSVIRSYNIAKNRFLIGAFTGLRMSDFNKLDKSEIRKGNIHVYDEKTLSKVVIPIHPIVKEIIDSGFDFSESLSDDKTRKYIKDICKYVGLVEEVKIRESIGGKHVVNTYKKYEIIGTHTARRSFATNAYLAGIPSISIMKITGHKRESTFLKYIKVSAEENANILASHEFFNPKEKE